MTRYNTFKQEKDTKATKDRKIRDIKNLFEYKKRKKIIINQ